MEVSSCISDHIKVDSKNFIICTGKNYHQILKGASGLKIFGEIINNIGLLSATSQNLKQPITTLLKFSGTEQRIYINVMENKVLGFVKVGEKCLFHRNNVQLK